MERCCCQKKASINFFPKKLVNVSHFLAEVIVFTNMNLRDFFRVRISFKDPLHIVNGSDNTTCEFSKDKETDNAADADGDELIDPEANFVMSQKLTRSH